MACNGHVNLAKIPPRTIDNTARDEGIACHWMIEQAHRGVCQAEELVNRKAPNGVYITEDMHSYAEDYLKDIMGVGYVEAETNHSDGVNYEINGRADHFGVEARRLQINDYKYGYRVVEPEENWTLISHAMGLIINGLDGQVDDISFKIYQPRPHHPKGSVREWVISVQQLWGEYYPELLDAFVNPKNEVSSGDHCHRCPSASVCPASQIANGNMLDVTENAFNADITPEDLARLLAENKRAKSILENNTRAYEELAVHLIKGGKVVPGYALEKELTNQIWNDEVTPELIKALTGVDVRKNAMITPKQAITAGLSEDFVNSWSGRNQKGLKLAKINPNNLIKKKFGKYLKEKES